MTIVWSNSKTELHKLYHLGVKFRPLKTLHYFSYIQNRKDFGSVIPLLIMDPKEIIKDLDKDICMMMGQAVVFSIV